MSIQRIIAFHWTASWLGIETDNEKFKIQAETYTIQNVAEIWKESITLVSGLSWITLPCTLGAYRLP